MRDCSLPNKEPVDVSSKRGNRSMERPNAITMRARGGGATRSVAMKQVLEFSRTTFSLATRRLKIRDQIVSIFTLISQRYNEINLELY